MSDRRNALVNAIVAHVHQYGYPPTLRYLADRLDVSRQTVLNDLNAMEEEGRIERVVTPNNVTKAIRIKENT